MFSDYPDDTFGCLCTFPHNYSMHLYPDTIQSLALLGAAIVLAKQGELEWEDYTNIPNSIPSWIVDEIKRIVPVESQP